ncbi:ribonuclease Z [Virgibacillus halodenitrificans]|uniref:ribonuclease Z n=1 Tax=Virgibacillus halodenitrificans TaxID=1482 RepID=UPI00045D207D|nr:ribonuclease Z [Virgibacillus halodenitrificans]CDQ35567.1 Ribonuclease Z [Virgibacillus halodenitrificans]
MELIFLGTGAGLPSKERNVSSVALTLLQEQNNIWLFDCGEATQHQILRTSIKPKKINKIFITHLHGDHIFGLPGLLSSRSFQGGEELLTIYGPHGIKEYVNTSLQLSGTHLTYPINIVELSEGKLFENDQFVVETKHLDHGLPSFGFRIIEKDKPGQLLVSKLKEIGIMPGPIYKQIKENSKIKLSNGQYIYRKEFLGEDKKGRVISILGDTRFTHVNSNFVKNSDVLVHEATFGGALEDLAEKYYHTTTEQAARLAKSSNCSKLILTHISSRYQSEDIENLIDEARRIFPNTEIANDFTHINL